MAKKNEKTDDKETVKNGETLIFEESSIKNTTFGKVPNNTKLKISGIVKSVDVKETAYAPVNRFKGEIAMQVGNEIILARYAFFPPAIGEKIMEGAKKLVKWESFEFSLSAIKMSSTNWEIEFAIEPRIEAARALFLLESIK